MVTKCYISNITTYNVLFELSLQSMENTLHTCNALFASSMYTIGRMWYKCKLLLHSLSKQYRNYIVHILSKLHKWALFFAHFPFTIQKTHFTSAIYYIRYYEYRKENIISDSAMDLNRINLYVFFNVFFEPSM